MAKKLKLIALFVLATVLVDAEAAESGQPMFTFGGFGSLGLSHSSQSLGDYVLDGSIPKGPGLSENWSATNDTRIAAHLAANFTPKFSAALQVDSEYHEGNTYQPEVEFANVKYAFLQNAYIRIGRVTLPTFMDSENRDVGYSYPWIHPPIEVYRQEPNAHFDGIDAEYRLQTGEVGNSIKAIYGLTTIDTNDNPVIETSRGLWGIFDTVEYGPASFRIGYQARETSYKDLLTGETGDWLRNSDLSVGVSYDPGDWFAKSEWIQRKSTYKLGAMYISAGYRVNKFTPYIIYSQNSLGSFNSGISIPATEDLIELANRSQSTVSLGVRWDFMRNIDLKFQYDKVKLGDHSNGFLANMPEDVNLYGTSFHVISAVADFVF